MTVNPSTLTFTDTANTPGNYDTAQTVTVTPVDDDDASNESVSVSLEASGGGYDNVSESVTVTVIEKPGPVTGLSAVAGDTSVTLNWSAPTSGGPVSAYEVRHKIKSGGSFTNWLDVGLTYSHPVTGLTNGTVYTFEVRATNSAGAGPAELVDVTPVDSGLTVSPTSLNLDEGGSSGSFTVALTAAPTSDVTLTVSSDDEGAVTVSPSTLTFTADTANTPGNYSTAQTVTVTPVDDDDASDESVSVSLEASGGGYEGVTEDVSVAVDDSDIADLSWQVHPEDPSYPGELRIVELEFGGGLMVALTAQPTEDVTINLTSVYPPGVETEMNMVLALTSLTFTEDNWNTAQSVQISCDIFSPTVGTWGAHIYLNASSEDSDYDSLEVIVNVICMSPNATQTAGLLGDAIASAPDDLLPGAGVPGLLTFAGQSLEALRLREGRAVREELPEAQGGEGALTYALSPELPAGLRFDAGHAHDLGYAPGAGGRDALYAHCHRG